MLLAANSEEEKYKWMEDLKRAVKQAKDRDSCGGCSQKRPQLANRILKFEAVLQKVHQLMEIHPTLKLGQLERSYLSSLLWKLWEEQAEMVQMTKLIPALFRIWTKDMRALIQCQRGEFAGIETRVSVCRSILYQFGRVQNNARFTSESNEWRIVEEVQDWKSMAETMGRIYKLLFVFLQDARGSGIFLCGISGVSGNEVDGVISCATQISSRSRIFSRQISAVP
ncbi:uncharacterized protein [Acropora muricata]|uniref:uncharacterized protein isoform X4 n=1 Tax=Acropora muricata TaxID=159855 RepID=UPI0034E5B712